jgi:hypothetical protein
MKKLMLIVLLLQFELGAHAAIALKSNRSDGQVEFEAIGRPSLLKIKGIGEGVTSNLLLEANRLSGKLVFNLKTLKTGIDLRDEHMLNKYLQVGSYSEAQLSFNSLMLPAGFSLTNPVMTNIPFKGQLLLHGVSQEIKGTFDISSAHLNTVANFEIKLSDFKIDIPSYLGVKVADVVKIKVSLNKLIKVNTK